MMVSSASLFSSRRPTSSAVCGGAASALWPGASASLPPPAGSSVGRDCVRRKGLCAISASPSGMFMNVFLTLGRADVSGESASEGSAAGGASAARCAPSSSLASTKAGRRESWATTEGRWKESLRWKACCISLGLPLGRAGVGGESANDAAGEGRADLGGGDDGEGSASGGAAAARCEPSSSTSSKTRRRESGAGASSPMLAACCFRRCWPSATAAHAASNSRSELGAGLLLRSRRGGLPPASAQLLPSPRLACCSRRCLPSVTAAHAASNTRSGLGAGLLLRWRLGGLPSLMHAPLPSQMSAPSGRAGE
mmetsp:Transcript_8491/g.24002  ORF Transcript_8491/g.24002 Transcript_8491/m.24002 type:complete len:310 (-) Transcript_8491:1138-2067(-)